MSIARSVRFFVNLNLGLGLVFYGLLVKFMHWPALAVLCHYSSVARFQVTVLGLGGSTSCLVTLMVLDFGRVMNLT
jgi:hypothetical protein